MVHIFNFTVDENNYANIICVNKLFHEIFQVHNMLIRVIHYKQYDTNSITMLIDKLGSISRYAINTALRWMNYHSLKWLLSKYPMIGDMLTEDSFDSLSSNTMLKDNSDIHTIVLNYIEKNNLNKTTHL